MTMMIIMTMIVATGWLACVTRASKESKAMGIHVLIASQKKLVLMEDVEWCKELYSTW